MTIQPYILIGGDSTRFGRDKATFEFEGEMLAERALRIVETATPNAAAKFVSKEEDRFLDRMVVGDAFPYQGAAGAIHAAIADAETDWIFVLACDLPMVTAEFVSTLSRFADEGYGCIIPVQPDGRWQPLCALYNASKCLQVFAKAVGIDGRHPSLRAIVETISPRIVEFEEYAHLEDATRLLTNVNTVADLESI